MQVTGHQIQDPEPSVKPQIASPILKRAGNSAKSDLEPHLHLMCDLLPCPHQDSYSSAINKTDIDDINRTGKPLEDKNILDFDSGAEDTFSDRGKKKDGFKSLEDREKRQGKERENKEEKTHIRQKSSDRYKYLEAEKPDEGVISESESTHSDRERLSSKKDKYEGTSSAEQRTSGAKRSDDDTNSEKSYRSGQSSKSESRKSSDRRGKVKVDDAKDVRIDSNSRCRRKDGMGSDKNVKLVVDKPRGHEGQGHREEKVRGQGKPVRCRSPSGNQPKKPIDSAIGQVQSLFENLHVIL